MKALFFGCGSLKCLPDISKWNTNNITNMSELFYNCKLLSSLPDISNWETNKVSNINDIFFGCDSLVSIPNISKWNFEKIKAKNINNILLSDSSKESISISSDDSFLSKNSNEYNAQILPVCFDDFRIAADPCAWSFVFEIFVERAGEHRVGEMCAAVSALENFQQGKERLGKNGEFVFAGRTADDESLYRVVMFPDICARLRARTVP